MAARGSKGRGIRALVVFVAAAAVGLWLWTALAVGPEPVVAVGSERPAVGRATGVSAHFSVPSGGLTAIRLEVVQGERTEVLAEQSFTPAGALPFVGDAGTREATLHSVVGVDAQPWLVEGEVVLRAVAERAAGALRRPDPVVVERPLPVRLRPPRLELASSQHYARQGGAGAVVFRVGDAVASSGVRAGDVVSTSFPLPGGGPGDRFVIYALPWDLADATEIRLFAEDDAGNRAERPFLDLFKPMPPRRDTIRVSDAFLERVVPAVASQTPGFDASGSLLDQYLRINRELRAAELARVAELSRASEPDFLWSGPFLQMANSALQASFAEARSYVYEGDTIDQQTHLGLDLASTERAPVPAPNSGRVLFAGWMSLYGNAVVIDHGFGLVSLCGHLSSTEVAAGDRVAKGDVVGRTGVTGLAGGDHLHLEVFVQGQSVDPVEWFDGKWMRDNLASKLPVPLS